MATSRSPRGDLARILYESTAESCEFIFDDTVTALIETDDGIDIKFARAAPRTFDLVIGASGMHSTVRPLAYGPESDCVRYLMGRAVSS